MTDFRIGNGMSAFHDAIPESGLAADGPYLALYEVP
ncbi:hypothetical protein MTsN3n11_28920 [Qipengyuania sp. MTN3-11]